MNKIRYWLTRLRSSPVMTYTVWTNLTEKTFKYKDFILKLHEISKGGVLKDMIMDSCVVNEIPADITPIKIIKHEGKEIMLLMSIPMENCYIVNNIFNAIKKKGRK